MEENKEYYAFISYKREDEKWAKWLQHKLEHYKFPTNLNGRTDLPKHIRPTFRDVTDLTPGLLSEEIHNALCNSQWLVIVCSPRSAKSPWVCKEAQTFIDLGRADHIIPFVIEGTPFSGDTTTECYPESLLHLTGSKELLAANINEMGRDAAAIKVVARMFNLRFDTLWQRHEREQRQKRWMWIGCSILIALIGLIVGGIFFLLNKEINEQKQHIEDQQKMLRNDSAMMAEHIERIQRDSFKLSVQNDSIVLQNKLILQQKNGLDSINKELKYANIHLVEEKNRVILANRETQIQYAKFVAQKSNELIDDNDFLSARRILLNVVPNTPTHVPYIPEVEYALRRSFESNSCKIVGHISSVKSALISPDGNIVVSSAKDDNIKIWDTSTGLLLDSIHNIGTAPSMIFFKDGNLLVSNKDSVTIWELTPLKMSHSYKNKELSNSDILDVDNANRFVFVSNQNNYSVINVMDGYTGHCISSIPTYHTSPIKSAIFLPDNQIAASMSGSIKIYDIKERKLLREWKAHEYGVGFLHSNKEGTKLISGEFGKISFYDPLLKSDSLKIWDVKLGKQLKAFPLSVENALYSPDENCIIAIKGTDLLVLNSEDGAIIKTLRGRAKLISLGLDEQGEKMISFSSGVIRIWDKNALEPKEETENMTLYNLPLTFSPNGNRFLMSCGDSINAYDTFQLKQIKKFGREKPYTISSIRFDKKGERFITSDGIATIWDASTFRVTCVIRTLLPDYAEFCPYGNRVLTVANSKNDIKIWDISKGDTIIDHPAMVLSLEGCAYNNNMAAFSPNGKNIVSAADDGIIRIWRTDKNVCIDSLVGHKACVYTTFYSPNGKLIISASADKTIKIWDATKKTCMRTLEGHTGGVRFASFSDDGKYIISTSFDCTTRVWNASNGALLKVVNSKGSDATLSPDGRKLLVVDQVKSKGSRGYSVAYKYYDIPSYQELIEKVRKLFGSRVKRL